LETDFAKVLERFSLELDFQQADGWSIRLPNEAILKPQSRLYTLKVLVFALANSVEEFVADIFRLPSRHRR
jgi:hypothetical protein